MNSPEIRERELARERRARIEAERLLEAKSAELHAANQRLRRLYDHAADAIFVHDASGNIIDVNRSACEQLAYRRDELLSMTVQDIGHYPTDHLEQQWQNFPQDLPIQFDGTHRRSDGSIIPVEVRVAQIEAVPERRFLAISRDISVRSRQRELLEASRERLRRLASEVTLAEAKERRRLAQVLHDTIGHDLAVVRMHIKRLSSQVDGEREQSHANAAVRLIEEVVRQVRQVTFDLSPATLFELGLPAAVKVVARVVSEEHESECRVETHGQWRSVPMDLSILLFYATRELVHNAIKHAEARSIQVELDRGASMIEISVADDGIGFVPESPGHDRDAQTTFGLFSIRERLAGLGGELQIKSDLEMGTRVTMTVPCKAESEGDAK